MKFTILPVLALVPAAMAALQGYEDRSTVYLTTTISKITTHYVTASVYVPTSTPTVYYSSAPEYYSSSTPCPSSSAVYTYHQPPSSYVPSASPTTYSAAPTYTAPPPTPTPGNAAGQMGANIAMAAGVAAGLGAILL